VEPTVLSWTDADVTVDRSADPRFGGTLTVGAGRPTRVAVTADRAAFESEYLSTLTDRDVESSVDLAVSGARSDYIAEADRICARANAEAEAVYESVFSGAASDAPPTAELMSELWSRLEPILSTQVVSLREVMPPPDDAATLRALYDDLAAVVDSVSESVDAALAGDDEALARITGQSDDEDPFGDVDRRAREFGFRVCGADGG